MAVTFSADEIFEMAQQIERNGGKFYRKGAKGVSDAQLKKMFEELADMEVDHEKTFAAMQDELASSERLPSAFDPNDEVGMYLRAMADGRVFDKDDIDSILEFVKEKSKRIKIDATEFKWPFLIIALILFLAEIGLRRLWEMRSYR